MSETTMESMSQLMTKHYIISLNSDAQYPWDRCTLRNPITAEHPDFASLIAAAVGETDGSYLISVNIEVKVLEKAPNSQQENNTVDLPAVNINQQIKELVA